MKNKKDETRESPPKYRPTSSKGRVPRLRFPEFKNNSEWKEKEVGDVFEVTRGYVLPMTDVNDSFSSKAPYPVYSSQTMNNGLAGYYSEYLYENAITWTTDGANAGDVNYRPGKFYCTNVCGVLLNAEGNANACIAELINAVSKKHVSYVGNPKLMNGVMSKINIPFPSIPEQQKIAACLSSLDSLLAAHAKKLEALKDYKKGIMQKLFPAEGETVPRLRFPEFTGICMWRECSLENIVEKISSGTSQQSNLGSFPLYGSTGIIGKCENAEYSGSFVLVARVVANAGSVIQVIGGFGATDNVLVIRAKESVNTNYLAEYLVLRDLAKLKFGSGQPLVTGSQLKSLKILLPPLLPEQQKIASALSSLDSLIAAEARKIEELKEHKRGLMQGLFPSPEESSELDTRK